MSRTTVTTDMLKDGAGTNAKLADMATQTFKGRNTGGTGDPEDLAIATAKTMLGIIAGQIAFPAAQNPSADANTLDDYEEGTWTPSVGGTATYTTQSGSYTKIGRLVTIDMKITINAIGTGSTTTVTGLPFTVGADTIAAARVSVTSATAIVSVGAFLVSGSVILRSRTAASVNDATNSIFVDAGDVHVGGSYRV